MSSSFVGYRLTCDGCGVRYDRDTAGDPLDNPYSYQSATTLRGMAQGQGWITTSHRRIDGTWAVYDNTDRLRPAPRNTNPLDACPDCASDWVPPLTKAAQLEMSYRSRAQMTDDVTSALTRLVAENAELRLQLQQMASPR